MKRCCILILIWFSLPCFCQEKKEEAVFNAYEDTLKSVCKQLFTAKNDTDKRKYNQQLLLTFEKALQLENSFSYPFDSLRDVARLVSSDKTFRIINWNVPYNDGTQEYFGFVQNKHTIVKKKGLFGRERTTTVKLHPLIDKSSEIKNPENSISDNRNWYGMLYYTIVTKKTKKKTYYTLLAWDGNDKLSKKKIIDVLTFDEKGVPRFGADIFDMPKKNPKRIIFEYAANCTMSLKYNSKKDFIAFDHLAPETPQLEGQFQYYCTDMSYDGFSFKRGKWNYIEDLDVTNEKDPNDKYYNDPHNVKPTRGSNSIIPKQKKKTK